VPWIKSTLIPGLLLITVSSAVVAQEDYNFWMTNQNWDDRSDNRFYRSDELCLAYLRFPTSENEVKVSVDWYMPDGNRYSHSSGIVERYDSRYERIWINGTLRIKDKPAAVVLGKWSIKIVIKTMADQTVFDQTFDFYIQKDEDDPPERYHYQPPKLGKAYDYNENKILNETSVFTSTDDEAWVNLMFDFYHLDSKDSFISFRFDWYFDEKTFYIHPRYGSFPIPSPFNSTLITSDNAHNAIVIGGYSRLKLPWRNPYYKPYGKWHVDISIKDNDNEWQLVETIPFTVINDDDEPPTIEITYPQADKNIGYETTKGFLTLSGTASDNKKLDRVTWENNRADKGTASGTKTWTQTDIKLRDGENILTATAYDDADNKASDSITVLFENERPDLEILEAELVATPQEEYRVHLYASDFNENLRDISINWGDGSPVETKGLDDPDVSRKDASVVFFHTYQEEGIFAWTAIASDEENEAAIIISPLLVGDEEATKDEDCEGLVYDPIDITTGAQLLQHNLLTVQGLVPITFGLDYYSRLLKVGPAGRGWEDRHFGAALTEYETGDVKINWTTNRYNFFQKNEQGGYQPRQIKCHFDRLVKNADGSFTLTRHSGKVYQFNAEGRLLEISNKKGQSLHLSYDSAGRVSNVTEPVSGVFLTYAYNAAGLLETVTDPLGRQARLTYDDQQNLIKITNAAGQSTTYTYDKLGQTLTGTNDEGQVLFHNTYNEDRRIIEQSDGTEEWRYNKKWRLLYKPSGFHYVTDPDTGKVIKTWVYTRLNGAHTYHFNENFQVIEFDKGLRFSNEVIYYRYNENGKRSSVGYNHGRTTAYEYDANGNLITITDALDQKTRMTYDDHNNLLSVTKPLGQRIQLDYDDHNNLIRVTDPMGNITRYTYNSDGQLLTETLPNGGTSTYAYKNGRVVRFTNSQGVSYTLGYDAAGRLSTLTDVEGHTTTFAYDGMNRIAELTNPLGHNVSMTYNSKGKLLTFTDASGNITRRNYDAQGYLISQINALGQETRYEYDAEGYLLQIIDALGRVTSLLYKFSHLSRVINPLGNPQYVKYDEAGNLIRRDDASYRTVMSLSYNQRNQVTRITDALSNTTHFEYDASGQLLKTTDPLKRVTQLSYDDLGRLEESIDALLGKSSQTFDSSGNRTSLTDPNNNTTRFEFDSSGRLVQEILATGDAVKYSYSNSNQLLSMTNARGQKREFEYDAAGRLTGWTDSDGSVAYTYDPNGNLLTVKDEKGTISRQYDKLNRVTQYTDTQGNTLKYAYDAVGNLITLTYPDGKQVHYEYDAADQLITVTDWANRATRYDYDKNGRLISINRPNGTQQTRVYDSAGQLLQQKEVVSKTGKVISQVDFSYDAAGNIIEEKTSREASPQINLEMTYAKANRLASYDDETVQLDADGNLIQGPLSGEMADFVFDSRNRLIQAGDTTYHYDAENQRIGVNQTQYVINSQPNLSQVLVKTDASGTQTYYVYGLGLIGQETAGEYTSYHFDLRGSTVALTDSSGQVLERFQYSPYGLLVGGEASTTPFLFNGMYGVMTDSNGLYYMRARFYSPEMRRFVNQDVLLGNIKEGQTLNRYAYVTGRPVSFVDPFGLSKCALKDFNNPDDFLACLFDEAFGWISEIFQPTQTAKFKLFKPTACHADFRGYPIPIGHGMSLGFGHSGVVVFDNDGNVTYGEYGRYRGNKPAWFGNVRWGDIEPIKFDENGIPTLESWDNLLVELAKEHGKNIVPIMTCTDVDAEKVIAYMKNIEEDINREKYEWWLNRNTCKTFAGKAISAGIPND
jgi:RHS repeat-associated protein